MLHVELVLTYCFFSDVLSLCILFGVGPAARAVGLLPTTELLWSETSLNFEAWIIREPFYNNNLYITTWTRMFFLQTQKNQRPSFFMRLSPGHSESLFGQNKGDINAPLFADIKICVSLKSNLRSFIKLLLFKLHVKLCNV